LTEIFRVAQLLEILIDETENIPMKVTLFRLNKIKKNVKKIQVFHEELLITWESYRESKITHQELFDFSFETALTYKAGPMITMPQVAHRYLSDIFFLFNKYCNVNTNTIHVY